MPKFIETCFYLVFFFFARYIYSDMFYLQYCGLVNLYSNVSTIVSFLPLSYTSFFSTRRKVVLLMSWKTPIRGYKNPLQVLLFSSNRIFCPYHWIDFLSIRLIGDLLFTSRKIPTRGHNHSFHILRYAPLLTMVLIIQAHLNNICWNK